MAEKTAEERYNQRLEQEKPVLDALLSWANSRMAAPKSALGKALNYLKEQWPYLTNYLRDDAFRGAIGDDVDAFLGEAPVADIF